MSATFEFQNPGTLVDKDLELVLVEKYPGNPDIGFVSAYRFEMRLTGTATKVGNIDLRVGYTNHLVMYGGQDRVHGAPTASRPQVRRESMQVAIPCSPYTRHEHALGCLQPRQHRVQANA